MNKSIATMIAAAAAACLSVGAHAASGTGTSDDNTNSVTRSSTTSTNNPDGSSTTTTTVTTESVTVPAQPTTLTRAEARDAKALSSGDYKARKKIAEANLATSKAECEATTYGSLERACKHDAKAQEKKDKADARLTHEAEKVDINNNTR